MFSVAVEPQGSHRQWADFEGGSPVSAANRTAPPAALGLAAVGEMTGLRLVSPRTPPSTRRLAGRSRRFAYCL